jgi:hypothetical protein
VLAEGGIKIRSQRLQQRLQDQTIRHRRDAELARATVRLGIITRRTRLGRYVPDNSCTRIAVHAVRRMFEGLVNVQSVDAGRAFVGPNPIERPLQVLSLVRGIQQG